MGIFLPMNNKIAVNWISKCLKVGCKWLENCSETVVVVSMHANSPLGWGGGGIVNFNGEWFCFWYYYHR